MDHPTLFRTGTCKDCGTVVVGGRAGEIPWRCAKCKRAAATRRFVERYVPKDRRRTCEDCGIVYDPRPSDTKSTRCELCRKARKREWARQWVADHPEADHASKRKWHEANTEYVKSAKHARRVLERDAASERFTRTEIFERDGWTCQICGNDLDRECDPRDNAAPSLDHIIPLAQGGTHVRANVQAACFGCNRRKGGRLAS